MSDTCFALALSVYALSLALAVWGTYRQRRWNQEMAALRKEIAALERINSKLDALRNQGEPRES